MDAGSDLIETNTFSATRVAQGDYACEHLVGQINRAAAEIARRAADDAYKATGTILSLIR